jgi:L-lactate permease
MSHNGIDIDQYILLIIYPSIAFFLIGLITKKKNVRKSITYTIQSVICFSFSIAYYLFVPHGGAQGLSLILGLFGVLLLVLARKERVNPAEGGGEEEEKEENVQKKKNNE